jgi:hypothetical protein
MRVSHTEYQQVQFMFLGACCSLCMGGLWCCREYGSAVLMYSSQQQANRYYQRLHSACAQVVDHSTASCCYVSALQLDLSTASCCFQCWP